MNQSEIKTVYYIENDVDVIPGRAVIVTERTEQGTLVGRYKGFCNPKNGTFTLYPARTSLVVNLKRLVKHTVSERLVRRCNNVTRKARL